MSEVTVRRDATPSSSVAEHPRANGEDRPILVVDDETTILHVIRTVLESQGQQVIVATSAEEAFQLLASTTVSVALIDIVLPKMSGLQLLEKARRIAPDTEIVLMTSHATLDAAMQAIRLGAYDFVQKPFDDVDSVWRIVKRALDHRNLALRNKSLLDDLQGKNALLAAAVSRLSTLIDAGLAMGDFRTTRELFDFVLGLIVREFNAARASLMLVEPNGKVLRIAASYGLTGIDTAHVEVAVGEGISGHVAASGQPMLVRDISVDPVLSSQSKPHLSDSFMCAPIALSLPIKTRDNVLGVLNVTDRAGGRDFDEDDLEYVASLSSQLAVAIERTRFVEELQEACQSLKQTQTELIFAERVKAIGEIAAGVAHDYNNTLGAIFARVQLARHRLERPEPDALGAANHLKIAEQVATQGASTIKRIQDFARRRSAAAQVAFDLNGVVHDAIEMTRPKWKDECESMGRRIDVTTDLGEVPALRGDVSDVAQIVSNILLNAVDAMPRGGTLHFRTYAEGDHVVLEAQDDGEGMSDEVQAKIFQPFFTTKPDGHGLGLSIVENIVARHGGDIKVSSHPGEGTAFRVRFPAALAGVEQPQELPAAPAKADRPRRAAHILLVDDLEAVRESCGEMLRAGGHTVSEASGGSEAISMIWGGSFDLVVTDLGMPDVSGYEVAQEAKRVHPDLPVILLSGWGIDQDENRVRDSRIDCVLPKPCPMEELLRAVDATLCAGGPERRSAA